MISTAGLLLATIVIAQSGSEWSLAPQLERGQELVYRGTYVEEAVHDGTPFRRAFDLETLVFVRERTPQTADVAVMTVLRVPNSPAGSPPGSVRLESGRVSPLGRFAWQSSNPILPALDGPTTLEGGLFVELPAERLGARQTWDTTEPPRPPRAWQALGTEMLSNARCVKVVGVQHTPDWERPTGAAPAWRRFDTVWLATKDGLPHKVERVVERQELAGSTVALTSWTRYDLVSQITYPDRLAIDRQREIAEAVSLAQKLAQWRSRTDAAAFERLMTGIDRFLEGRPATPYRPAIFWARKQAEAGSQGVAQTALIDVEPAKEELLVGRPAADFVTTDMVTGTHFRLQRLRGRPVLLAFYSPTSSSAELTLRCAELLHGEFAGTVSIAALAVTDDAAAVARQRTAFGLTLPILSGREAAAAFAPSTPRFVVLDANGVVRFLGEGWGSETPSLLREALTAACVTNRK